MDQRPSDLDPFPYRERDLISNELWERSLRRSRERRRVTAISRRNAPRRKGVSLATGAAILASPVLSPLAAAKGVGAGQTQDAVSTIAKRSGADTRLLEYGDTGPAVAAVQRQLHITADGIFGPQTRWAVKTFQRTHGLAVSGVVDAETWAKAFGGTVLFYDRSGSDAPVAPGAGEAVDVVVAPETDADEVEAPVASASSFNAAPELGTTAADPGNDADAPVVAEGEAPAPSVAPGAPASAPAPVSETRRVPVALAPSAPDPDRLGDDDGVPADEVAAPKAEAEDEPAAPVAEDKPAAQAPSAPAAPPAAAPVSAPSATADGCVDGAVTPVKGTVTGSYGEDRGSHRHSGTDVAAPTGTPVVAAQCGTVSESGDQGGGYGLMVCIRHANGVSTCYAHLSRSAVSVDQRVRAGELIGRVGCTGRCTGPHAHIEVRRDGRSEDPAPYLNGRRALPSGASASNSASTAGRVLATARTATPSATAAPAAAAEAPSVGVSGAAPVAPAANAPGAPVAEAPAAQAPVAAAAPVAEAPAAPVAEAPAAQVAEAPVAPVEAAPVPEAPAASAAPVAEVPAAPAAEVPAAAETLPAPAPETAPVAEAVVEAPVAPVASAEAPAVPAAEAPAAPAADASPAPAAGAPAAPGVETPAAPAVEAPAAETPAVPAAETTAAPAADAPAAPEADASPAPAAAAAPEGEAPVTDGAAAPAA